MQKAEGRHWQMLKCVLVDGYGTRIWQIIVVIVINKQKSWGCLSLKKLVVDYFILKRVKYGGWFSHRWKHIAPRITLFNSLQIKDWLLRVDTEKKLNLAWSRWFVVADDFEERFLSNVCNYKYMSYIHAFAWHLYPSRIVVNIKNICYLSYCHVFILEWSLRQGSSKLSI